jgi:hypothetical protein
MTSARGRGMVGPQQGLARKAAKEIGKGALKLMARKSGSRLLGHLQRDSRVWRKAFQHIKLHFGQQAGKPAHTVFAQSFRSEAAVRKLIRSAAAKPSKAPVVSRATIDGIPAGTPCVVIEKAFRSPIGVTPDGLPAHVLRIVVDYTGKPLTAFPVREAGKSTVKATATAIAAVLAPSMMLANLEEAYAAEAQKREERQEDLCGPHGLIDWVIEILVSPSCSAEPPSRRYVLERYERLIARVETELGTPLDDHTKASVRSDVFALWGWGGVD